MPARPRSLLLCVMCSLAPLAARALSFGSPPTAALTVPSPAAASSTVQIRCDATASSGNLVTRVTFTVSGGTLDNGLAQMDANVTPANAVTGFASWSTPAPGTYTVDCTARDNQLLNGIAPQRTVSVVAMAPPVIDSLVADATDVYPGTVVHLTASAHDPNGQAIAYTWSSTAGTLAPAGASADWTAPPVPGNAAVTLRAESAGGAVQQSVAIQTVLARSALAFSAPAGTPFVPQRIAVAADDRAFVTDAAAGRVTIFSRLGALAGSFAVAGRPAGIAVNDAGDRIFVSDLSRAAVDVYDPLGARLGT
ncbi:MAG TPA: hypothetical protein VIW03_17340, partial [Anaeromyxobacter sp.]